MLYLLICLPLYLFLLAVFARVLLSWFPLNPHGAMATVAGFLFTVTDPVMRPIQRALPMARFGRTAIDFSPVVVILGVSILQRILRTFGIC